MYQEAGFSRAGQVVPSEDSLLLPQASVHPLGLHAGQATAALCLLTVMVPIILALGPQRYVSCLSLVTMSPFTSSDSVAPTTIPVRRDEGGGGCYELNYVTYPHSDA